jgi:type II secretory pathway component PulF
MLDLDHIAETILQICQALQTVAEQGNHPDARAAVQTAAQEIEVALQQSSALTEVRQELIAAALEHVKDSVYLLAEGNKAPSPS